jgi:chromosome segregation ATPase
LNSKKSERDNLNTNAVELTSMVSMLQAQSNDLGQKYKAVYEEERVCIEIDIPSLFARSNLLAQDIQETLIKRNQLQYENNAADANISRLAASNAALISASNQLQKTLDTTKYELIKCNADNESNMEMIKVFKEDLSRYWRMEQDCKNDVHVYTERLKRLQIQYAKLLEEREFWYAYCRGKQSQVIANVRTAIQTKVDTLVSTASNACVFPENMMQILVEKRQEKNNLLLSVQQAEAKEPDVPPEWCAENISRMEECCK